MSYLEGGRKGGKARSFALKVVFSDFFDIIKFFGEMLNVSNFIF